MNTEQGPAAVLDMPISPLHDSEPQTAQAAEETSALPSVSIGTLMCLGEDGLPRVALPSGSADSIFVARAICRIGAEDVGREVVLNFEEGDPSKPIVLGLLRVADDVDQSQSPVSVSADGERLTLTASKEVVLRCGKASITLTRAGKVLIRGAYLLNRSSGVNRIKGGSVQIN